MDMDMDMEQDHVKAVPLPLDSRITSTYPLVNFADAYSLELPAGASTNPEQLARFIFSQLSPWMTALMKIRDALAAGFGLKTIKHLSSLGEDANASRVGFFKIYSTDQTEIVLGEGDKHLDFRLSLLCSSQSAPNEKRRLTLSTVVRCHNRLGRLYILLIAPFHRLIVRSILGRAARAGWPPARMTGALN
ncbi:DUF2867 domain-containing protein [Noviherbaspirillum sp. CPCC 100848]|uniref:DUF2867 domain-containing protein n=1 Tax=Noviherbaspirillum album TaxID=3080276 RepID=A0ABU6J237_9BURK|nr:DUF2867 domain-containing protein [Noviherbaspirillum sp. CPCC 100848]MEC4717680.1 DUF2867 domain-containing protein [Noviherbaspirillum sp. CPCC 100848]